MRDITLLAIVCVALATVIAGPTRVQVVRHNNKAISKAEIALSKLQNVESSELLEQLFQRVEDIAELKLILDEGAARATIQYQTKDWLSDVINAILGLGVGELLDIINTSLEELKNLIGTGVGLLQAIIASVDPATQNEIKNIIDHALGESIKIITPIMEDLGLVLPVLTKRSSTPSTRDAADLIATILGISLEEFLTNVTTALEESNALLQSTMNELLVLADKVSNPTAAEALRRTSNECLNSGTAVIEPVLDKLYRVLPSRVNPKGLVSNIISATLGFPVVAVARQLEYTLVEIESLVLQSVTELNEIIAGADEDIIKDANDKIIHTVKQIHQTMKPILEVITQFTPSGGPSTSKRTGKSSASDIVNTLFGLSLEDFMNYVDFVGPRVDKLLTTMAIDVKKIVSRAGTTTAIEFMKLYGRISESLRITLEPLIEQISPTIFPDKRVWVNREEFQRRLRSKTEQKHAVALCNFSFKTGFNKEVIFDIVSDLVGVNVTRVGIFVEPTLQEIGRLFTARRIIIKHFLEKHSEETEVATRVDAIIENSINSTLRVIQPLLDVFLHFIPNESRLDKDIVNGIIETFLHITLEDFEFYLEQARTKIRSITDETIVQVNHAVINETPATKAAVNNLITNTLVNAHDIVLSFVGNILPDSENIDQTLLN